MSKRKNKYVKKSFESRGGGADTSANIYQSMLLSPAWLDMKARPQMLYVCMKAQQYGQKHKPASDFPNDERFKSSDVFYFNHYLWKNQYCLYTNNDKCFYDDLKILVEHGFIEVLVSGQPTKTKSIYKYSSAWQEWKNKK